MHETFFFKLDLRLKGNRPCADFRPWELDRIGPSRLPTPIGNSVRLYWLTIPLGTHKPSNCTIVQCEISFWASHWSMGVALQFDHWIELLRPQPFNPWAQHFNSIIEWEGKRWVSRPLIGPWAHRFNSTSWLKRCGHSTYGCRASTIELKHCGCMSYGCKGYFSFCHWLQLEEALVQALLPWILIKVINQFQRRSS